MEVFHETAYVASRLRAYLYSVDIWMDDVAETRSQLWGFTAEVILSQENKARGGHCFRQHLRSCAGKDSVSNHNLRTNPTQRLFKGRLFRDLPTDIQTD